MILFENGLICTMKERPFAGSVLVKGAKIEKVSRGAIAAGDAVRVDLAGGVLAPGFVDAHTHEGMFQGEIGWAGRDLNEKTDPVTPHLRAIDGLNFDDPSLRDAPSGGVTAINTGPGSANVMGGLFCAIKTAGRTVDDMLVRFPSALKVAFGENPKYTYGSDDKTPQTRMAIAALLREWFFKAREYDAKLKRHAKKKDEDHEHDMKLEVLAAALRGDIPVHAHCHRADDILTAIRVAEEFGLKLVLVHATEGHLVADIIAAKKVPAVVGPSFAGREKPELSGITFATPGVLARAGVQVCLQSDNTPPLRYFQSVLCMAVKEGMDRDGALAAVTSTPARVLGLDGRIGTIAPRMDADLVAWSGHPVDFYSSVRMTFVNGSLAYAAPGVEVPAGMPLSPGRRTAPGA